jgi:two-component system, LuxR family, response regulator FixJ
MPQRNARVHIVDDDPGVLELLGRALTTEFVVERFATAEEFLDACRAADRWPDCMLLDVCLPGIGGLGLQERLVSEGFRAPIIFITGYATVPLAVQAVKWGAFDVLEKPFDAQVVVEKVRAALTRSVSDQPPPTHVAAIKARTALLSPREHQVLRLLLAAKSTKEIAAELQIGLKTVAKHRSRLLLKLGVDNVPELIRIAGGILP